MYTPESEYALCDFLDDLREGRRYDARRYCFVLGSGASVTSGVMTGQSLATNWIKELYLRQNPGKSPDQPDEVEAWATADNLSLTGFTYNRRAEFYGELYRRRFKSTGERWRRKNGC